MSADSQRLRSASPGAASPMRLVFVNHVHPESGLVAGLRLWRFAEELSRRGHRVLFITEALGDSPADTEAGLEARLDAEQWSSPFLLACGKPNTSQRYRVGRINHNELPFGKLRTAANIVLRGGVFWQWRKAAESHYDEIIAKLRPELVVGTFGNLDTLNIGRDLASRAGVPWVIDIKDPLPAFVPRPFWGLVRRRYEGAARVTFNSEFQRAVSGPVLGRTGEVIYSGADRADGGRCSSDSAPGHIAPFFTLIGSIYSTEDAKNLLVSFARFAESRRMRGLPPPELRYYGGDSERVGLLLAEIGNPPDITVIGQIARFDLLALCRAAAANCYVGSTRTFHHKLFELMATGRPVIAYPTEREESIRMAQQVGARLEVCRESAELTRAWETFLDTGGDSLRFDGANELSWSTFAGQLEFVLAASCMTDR